MKIQDIAFDRGYVGSWLTHGQALRVAISYTLPDAMRDRKFYEALYGDKLELHKKNLNGFRNLDDLLWYLKTSLNIKYESEE